MLTLVTPPVVEPVTVAEFRRDRRLDPLPEDDTESAEYLDCLQRIQAARGHVELYTRRALIRQQLRLSVAARYVPSPVRLMRPPFIEVESVTVDGAVLTTDDYDLDLDAGYLWPLVSGLNLYPANWLAGSGYATRVVVEYWAGYGETAEDVPAALRQAVLRIAGDLFEHREDAVVGAGVGTVSVTARTLMDPFRVCLL